MREIKYKTITSVKIDGEDAILDHLRRLGKAGSIKGREVIRAMTTKMVARAKPLTPDDPETQGALRDSVRIIKPSGSKAGKITGGIMAGGKALEERLGKEHHNMAAWAIVQHFDTTLDHPFGGGAMFLANPFFVILPEIPGALLAALDSEKP